MIAIPGQEITTALVSFRLTIDLVGLKKCVWWKVVPKKMLRNLTPSGVEAAGRTASLAFFEVKCQRSRSHFHHRQLSNDVNPGIKLGYQLGHPDPKVVLWFTGLIAVPFFHKVGRWARSGVHIGLNDTIHEFRIFPWNNIYIYISNPHWHGSKLCTSNDWFIWTESLENSPPIITKRGFEHCSNVDHLAHSSIVAWPPPGSAPNCPRSRAAASRAAPRT